MCWGKGEEKVVNAFKAAGNKHVFDGFSQLRTLELNLGITFLIHSFKVYLELISRG